jgi:phage FluMu gp28-like protein
MAEPIDGSTAFITYEMIDAVVNADAPRALDELALTENALYAGWDIGRHRDLSVITVLEDMHGFLIARAIKVFEKTPFRAQKKYLDKVMRLPSLRRVCIDKTGMGIPLHEEAAEAYGVFKAEGVTFTAAVKETLAAGARNIIEDRRIILPDSEALKDSIHSIKRLVTSAGNVRFDAGRTDATGHADHFWSLALAIHAKTGGPSGPTWAQSAGEPSAAFDKFIGKISYGGY